MYKIESNELSQSARTPMKEYNRRFHNDADNISRHVSKIFNDYTMKSDVKRYHPKETFINEKYNNAVNYDKNVSNSMKNENTMNTVAIVIIIVLIAVFIYIFFRLIMNKLNHDAKRKSMHKSSKHLDEDVVNETITINDDIVEII